MDIRGVREDVFSFRFVSGVGWGSGGGFLFTVVMVFGGMLVFLMYWFF